MGMLELFAECCGASLRGITRSPWVVDVKRLESEMSLTGNQHTAIKTKRISSTKIKWMAQGYCHSRLT